MCHATSKQFEPFIFSISQQFYICYLGILRPGGSWYPHPLRVPPPPRTHTDRRQDAGTPPPPTTDGDVSCDLWTPARAGSHGRGYAGGGTRAGLHGRGYTGGVHGRGYTGGGTREGVTVRSNGKLRCAISPWLLVRQGNTYIYIKCRICIRSLLFYKALYTKLHECHLDTVCHQTHGFCIFLFAHMNNTYTPTVFPSLREYHPDKTEKIPLPYKKMRLPAWK